MDLSKEKTAYVGAAEHGGPAHSGEMRFADPAIETGVEPRPNKILRYCVYIPSYTSETGMAFQIPSISPNDLSIFDDEYNTEKCAGYLSKKASKQR